MHPLAPTSRHRGPGRGAFRPELLAGGAFLALVLAALVGLVQPVAVSAGHGRFPGGGSSVALAAPVRCEALERKPLCVKPRAGSASEWAAILGASRISARHLPSPPRGRAGFQPDMQALHRVVRERQDALLTALVRESRRSAMPASAGHEADRPTIVTRPLRGPPERV